MVEIRELEMKMTDCARLLYQNKEQQAYQLLNGLLVSLNEMLQQLARTAEQVQIQEVLNLIREFLEAYEAKDQLVLADLLYYAIPQKAGELGLWDC